MKFKLCLLAIVCAPCTLYASPDGSVSSDGSVAYASPEAFMEMNLSLGEGSFDGLGGIENESMAYEGDPELIPEMGGANTTPLSDIEVEMIHKLQDPVVALKSIEKTSKERASQETVIRRDTRLKIDPYDTAHRTSPMARRTALITYINGSNSYVCTGWFIGKDTVVTAGHCVHGGGSGESWSRNVKVYPAYSQTNSPRAPYGHCSARRLYSVTGWTGSGNPNFDYGAIKLNCNIGYTTGWFGFRALSNAAIKTTPAIINGYPGDKPTTDPWLSADRVRTYSNNKIYYRNDTAGGMSGSPVWYDDGSSSGAPWAIGIHTSGVNGAGNNSGVRINSRVFNNLSKWKNAN